MMKSISFLAVVLLALSVRAYGLEESLESKRLEQNVIPNIMYYTAFKMSWSMFKWNGYSLNSYYASNANSLVDMPRNRIINHAKIRLDDFGLVDMTVLQNFN